MQLNPMDQQRQYSIRPAPRQLTRHGPMAEWEHSVRYARKVLVFGRFPGPEVDLEQLTGTHLPITGPNNFRVRPT
jgi:hypothetical protein